MEWNTLTTSNVTHLLSLTATVTLFWQLCNKLMWSLLNEIWKYQLEWLTIFQFAIFTHRQTTVIFSTWENGISKGLFEVQTLNPELSEFNSPSFSEFCLSHSHFVHLLTISFPITSEYSISWLHFMNLNDYRWLWWIWFFSC